MSGIVPVGIGLIKKLSGNGTTAYSVEPQTYVGAGSLTDRESLNLQSTKYHQFTPEEISQVKMLDLRTIMKEHGIKLMWLNGQHEGKCPFHEDKLRAPRLFVNQKEGVWLWRCDGSHHGGDIIDFVKTCEGKNFPRAVEHLRSLIMPVPRLNGGGMSLKEILGPIQEREASFVNREAQEINESSDRDTLHEMRDTKSGLLEKSDDSATFKYGDLIYHVKDLKSASKNHLKIILKLTHKDGHFTDRVDLHSARARRSFANQASDRLNLQSAQIEEHLESTMESLEVNLTTNDQRLTTNDKEMTEEEKNQALELLRDPHFLDRMAQDLDKLGYVGEAINKKILYLVGTSRLLDKPVSAIVRSGSGAGKSALIEQVLSLMPTEDVLLFSRITPQSLFYMGQEALDRKILAVDEREGSQAADYSIRTLQSRGKLTLAASQKDPKTGEWKTFIKEFSARTPYMESSTKERINEENLNRCFELYLDESAEQTKNILEAQRKSAAGINILTESEKIKLRRLYQNAQRELKPMEVRVPYELEVGLPNQVLRTRRDHERFISLIKVITLLHQRQRKIEGDSIEASLEDYELAKELARPAFANTASDMPEPLAKFYELLKKKVHEEAGSIEIEDFKFTRREVRTWLGLPDHIVKRSMKALEGLEYVQVRRANQGSRYQYSLIGQ